MADGEKRVIMVFVGPAVGGQALMGKRPVRQPVIGVEAE
jgi:hypothetical protein